MTVVSTAVASGPYNASGQTSFRVGFQSAARDEIEVLVNDAVASTSSYVFNRDADGTGNVVFWAPVNGTVLIRSVPKFDQQTSFNKHGSWDPSMLNAPLDRAALRDLYLKEQLRLVALDAASASGGLVSEIAARIAGDAAEAAQRVAGDNDLSQMIASLGVLADNTVPVPSLGTLAAMSTAVGVAYLYDTRRAGTFRWDAGNLTAKVAADPLQGIYVPPTSDLSGASGAWVRQTNVLTPFHFGATGSGDDTVAMQAFFDSAFDVEHAHRYTFDWSGAKWPISSTIYAVYPTRAPASPTVALRTHQVRHFICGTLRVLPITSQPGGVAMEHALIIGGYPHVWEGSLYIDGRDDNGEGPNYDDLRMVNGVQIFNCHQSQFGDIIVDGAKRIGVEHPDAQVSTTFRPGSPFEVTYSGGSNNIGNSYNVISSTWVGPSDLSAERSYTRTFTALSRGRLTNPDDESTFTSTTPDDAANGAHQRSRLTVADTGELRVLDIGKVRREVTQAYTGNISADGAAGTITWAAGNPVDAGFVVGERIRLLDDNNVGANDTNDGGTQFFEIIGFSGTSNRVIKVAPKPITESARAYSGVASDWSYHQIRRIESATSFTVFPWVPDRSLTNGVWYSCHGATLSLAGGNTANVTVKLLQSIVGSTTLSVSGFYGPHIGSLLSEAGEIAILHGKAYSDVQYGTKIDHIHAEGVFANLIQVTASASSTLMIAGKSNFYQDKVYTLQPRLSATVVQSDRALVNTTIDEGGRISTSPANLGNYSGVDAHTGERALSNVPGYNNRWYSGDNATVELAFDNSYARNFAEHHKAEFFWIGPSGVAPLGTLTFSLSADLTHRGWTVVGTATHTAPAKPSLFRIFFKRETKQVFIQRFAAA